MRVKATGIEVNEIGKKYILCMTENNRVVREPLPESELGKEIEKLIKIKGMQVYLEIDNQSNNGINKINSFSAIPPAKYFN